MEIRKYQKDNTHELYEYWQRVGAAVSYFFPVSIERWQACLLKDELNGERLFEHIGTYFAIVNEQIVGLVQYGRPHFVWDAKGQKHYNPRAGVIRQLYFEKNRPDVGEALLLQSIQGLSGCGQLYAFYHILGMSCNAHHGKLHNSQSHIEQVLLVCGFRTEHENVYYVLDMKQTILPDKHRLDLDRTAAGESEERFVARSDAKVVGTAQLRYVDRLTDGYTPDTVYLAWIGVEKSHRGQGIGTELMRLLVTCLLGEGYRYLHTDTASGNVRAQQFYERLGFQEVGYTRSYVQAQRSALTLTAADARLSSMPLYGIRCCFPLNWVFGLLWLLRAA